MKPETFMIVATCIAWVAALYMATRTSEAPSAAPLPLPGTNVSYQPYVFLDNVTGCQYLSTHTSAPLTPRIAADGKTHVGCKGAQP